MSKLKELAEKAAEKRYPHPVRSTQPPMAAQAIAREGFRAGASWALKNLPRCVNCSYFSRTSTLELGIGTCLENNIQNADSEVHEDFGCILHSELEGE